jgi:hypothetical protein
MDGMRDEFLASPGLSLDEHGRIGSRHSLDLFQNDSQAGAVADDLLESPGSTILISYYHRFVPQSPGTFM